MGRKIKRRKEDIAEDCCFFCKDGGSMRICDYKDCLKAYHPQCVKRDDSFLEAEDRWTCGWHYCLNCGRTAKFQCFCCPKAICARCLCDVEFALVRGRKGFCSHCLELASLIESQKEVNLDGGKIDFDDQSTYEYMFKVYWSIIKEKEGLTLEHINSASNRLKNGKGGSNESDGEEEDATDSEDEDSDESEEWTTVHKRKRSKKKLSFVERKLKSKEKKFIGWGSKTLAEFLASVGIDKTEKLSQFEVSAIITDYCHEKGLFDPEKKKKVICDARLQSLFRRKSFNKNSLYKLLTNHFAENWGQSEDEFGWSSEDRDESPVACKREQRLNSDRRFQRKEDIPLVQQNGLALIVAQNIKRVYLKRSLVQDLSKQAEDFESKLIGSFVRVKSDPNDYLQKNSHLLVQVTGLLRNDKTKSEILLQVSNMIGDVPISKLSDDDFFEEECSDLLQRMENGLPKRPTVMELEKKATSLHQDITKHWIEREMALLQRRINQANEKGWRRELNEYMDSLLLLQTPSEQSRLLSQVPEIIADTKPACEDSPIKDEQKHDSSQGSDTGGTSKTPTNDTKGNEMSSRLNGRTGAAEKDQPLKVEHEKTTKRTSNLDLIELSDDDEPEPQAPFSKQTPEDIDSSIWYCMTPSGLRVGPYSMSLLKEWKDTNSNSQNVRFKVLKSGQKPEEAIHLSDAIRQNFSRE